MTLSPLQVVAASTLILEIGVFIGIKVTRKIDSKRMEVAAERSVSKAVRTATAIETLLSREVFKIVASRYPFPYNDNDVKRYIMNGINFN